MFGFAQFLRGYVLRAHAVRPNPENARISGAFPLVRPLQSPILMDTRTKKTVLVATDFSDGSDEALERAIEIATPAKAPVEILHVIELAEEFPFGSTYFDADYGALYASVDRELGKRAERVRSAGLACETKIVEGSSATEITKRGREIDAGLLVVGTHGRTGLAHAVMGSVAERVVRHASSPVLSVPFSKKVAA